MLSRLSLFLVSALAIRQQSHVEDQSGPWCWNCCDTAKCSDHTHRSRHLGNAKFIDCQPVTGAYRKDGKVVSPGMVQEGLYFGKASYVCEEKCTMTLDWSGTPTRTTGSVFRGGGVENSRCVYESVSGLKWKEVPPTPPPYKAKEIKKTWNEWLLEPLPNLCSLLVFM